MDLNFTDTIAGIATAPGQAGVGIIRISGPDALSIIQKLFTTNKQSWVPRMLYYGWIQEELEDHTFKKVDEVLCTYMPGPKSFTAEDVVEIHCHGGFLILEKTLNLCMKLGARLSNPGEFTQRAFVNGRIDLTQAEATNDIVQAKTELGLNMVVNQLKGNLYKRITEHKERIAWILALLNASIDFPEEDVIFAHQEDIISRIEAVKNDLNHLIKNAEGAMILKEGYKVALVGEPNVGKSSLLNALLEEDRAIVTPIAGTTRDSIEEGIILKGIPLSIIDTAGIRSSDDTIEMQGVQRSFQALEQADLALWVIDSTEPHYELQELEDHVSQSKPLFMVYNKMDLLEGELRKQPYKNILPQQEITISAKHQPDIEKLKETIYQFIVQKIGGLTEDTGLTNLRQKEATKKAYQAILQAEESLQVGVGEELIAVDLGHALDGLGDILGETTPDEMLGRIFENFCIGK